MIVDNISVDMVEQLLCWQRCTPSDPLLTKVDFISEVVTCVFNDLLSIVSVLIVVVVCSLQRRFVYI